MIEEVNYRTTDVIVDTETISTEEFTSLYIEINNGYNRKDIKELLDLMRANLFKFLEKNEYVGIRVNSFFSGISKIDSYNTDLSECISSYDDNNSIHYLNEYDYEEEFDEDDEPIENEHEDYYLSDLSNNSFGLSFCKLHFIKEDNNEMTIQLSCPDINYFFTESEFIDLFKK